MRAPVVLIAFNRPAVTERMLSFIRAAAPPELFLIADGPRPGNETDPDACAAVRQVLEQIDWPCRVHRRYAEGNLGLDASVELGLDWVFDHVEEAVIVEDDCLCSPDFFRFCDELLERYRDQPRVKQIAGCAPAVAPALFGDAAYGFTAFGPIWGWATWRDAWRRHRERFPRAPGNAPPPPPLDVNATVLLSIGARRYFADVVREPVGARFSWDSYWALSIVRDRGLVATSRANLIENIGLGLGDGATHGAGELPQPAMTPVSWPLSHPSQVALNPALERAFERTLVAFAGRAARFVAQRLGASRARQAVRALAGTWRNRHLRQ